MFVVQELLAPPLGQQQRRLTGSPGSAGCDNVSMSNHQWQEVLIQITHVHGDSSLLCVTHTQLKVSRLEEGKPQSKW
jgi:hypothetical protein